ncbi:DUF3631 domain-containing protein [Micrococcus yunnanensis]|uniref:DUF3631 domain-containing protein n=1 Tax=Micrococcus yunnanensis TaxID=566027 RepID=UPI003014D66C
MNPLDMEEVDVSDYLTEPVSTTASAPIPSGSSGSSGSSGLTSKAGSVAEVLEAVDAWLARFIRTTTPEDVHLLALWAAHTYVVEQTYTSPRLQIDSVMPGSGKTTALEHLAHLARRPLSASTISSEALLPRVLESGIRTILIDEADRSLDQKNPIMAGVLATINTGYKRGGSRPVLVKDSEGNWTVREMSTFAPVALAGNNPNLPDDTRSRCIRVLLMPDLDGTVEPSDWEDLEDDAERLQVWLSEEMDAARDAVAEARPVLPDGCVARHRERWRPLARVAHVAGGRWPGIVEALILRDLAELETEREEGLSNRPLRVHLLYDLADVWRPDETFIPTPELIARLAVAAPTRWGMESAKGLTPQGMGRMLMTGYKIASWREPNGERRRGYTREALEPAWRMFHITPAG